MSMSNGEQILPLSGGSRKRIVEDSYISPMLFIYHHLNRDQVRLHNLVNAKDEVGKLAGMEYPCPARQVSILHNTHIYLSFTVCCHVFRRKLCKD